MEIWKSLPAVVRQGIVSVGIFVLGAAFSLGYSYRPLHGALTYRVEALETRLDERNLENQQLEDALASLESSEETRVEPEALAQVERELARTKKALAAAEKAKEAAEKKRRTANANTDRWRKRFESLRDQQPTLPAVKDPSPSAPSPEELTAEQTLTAPSPSEPPTQDAGLRPAEPHGPELLGNDDLGLP